MVDLGYNRNGAHLWVDKNNMLCADASHQYCLAHIRCILNKDDSTIMSIDPTGGPFMSVGDQIGKKEISGFESTDKGFKIFFFNKK